MEQANTNATTTSPRIEQYRLKIMLVRSTTASTGWLVDDIDVV